MLRAESDHWHAVVVQKQAVDFIGAGYIVVVDGIPLREMSARPGLR